MDVSEVIKQDISLSQRHPWETTRARIITFLLKKNLKRTPLHFLEVGSGDAYVSQQLGNVFKNARFSALDTAYTPELLASINNIGNKNIDFFSSGSDFLTTNRKADVVLLPDVLEHVEDDRHLWNFAVDEDVCTPGSIILATVPAFQGIFSEHDRMLNHFRRYTRRQLVNLCRSHKMKIVESGYFFFSLLVCRWISVMFRKPGTSRKSITNWNHNRSLTSIIEFLLWIDFRFSYALSRIGIKIPGLSCYCVCQKLH